MQQRDGFLQAELAQGRDGDGVPEVEGVTAQVIVADAGMLADDRGSFVHARRVDAGGNETGFIAETAGVEDGADLTNDFGGLEILDAVENFLFANAELVLQFGERALRDGHSDLKQFKKLPVGGVGNCAHHIIRKSALSNVYHAGVGSVESPSVDDLSAGGPGFPSFCLAEVHL